MVEVDYIHTFNYCNNVSVLRFSLLGSLCLEDWVFLTERKKERERKMRKPQKKEKDRNCKVKRKDGEENLIQRKF